MLSWLRQVHVTPYFIIFKNNLGLWIEDDYLLKSEVKKNLTWKLFVWNSGYLCACKHLYILTVFLPKK